MSDPRVALAEPLFPDEAPRRAWCSRKVLVFSLLTMGLGCAVIWSQMPSTDPAVQETTVNMPVMQRAMQPMTTWMQPKRIQPFRSVWTFAKFPNTDIEIDSKGVEFPVKAVCEVGEAGKACDGSTSKTGVCGMVSFTQTDAETTEIEYEVTGLSPGLHGFHIHEKADFSNGCASAGPHYNPFKQTHGGPGSDIRHVGDLGNIEANADGVAKGKMTDKYIKLFGEYTVVGRSMMIHADPDDLGEGPLEGWPEKPPPPAPAQHTKTTGNAGARIGCGVINKP